MLFSNILVLVGVIGRNTTAIADMDPGSVALNGAAERICWKDRTFYKPLSPPGHLDIKTLFHFIYSPTKRDRNFLLLRDELITNATNRNFLLLRDELITNATNQI